MDIASATAAAASGSAATTAGKSLADGFDTFLTLLTTQLQNQDPLSPMDSAQFTEQLVQFSQVEQAIATNKNLEQAISLMAAGRNADAVSYLGKEISAIGDANMLSDGVAVWSYSFEEPVVSGAVTVTDASGKLVYVGTADIANGVHDLEWNGKDNAGNQLDDGVYTIAVAGKDEDGNVVNGTTFVHGAVNGVNTTGDEPYVLIGPVAVPLANVLEVRDPPPAEPAPQA